MKSLRLSLIVAIVATLQWAAAAASWAQSSSRIIEVEQTSASAQPAAAPQPSPLTSANIGNPEPAKGPEQRVALVIGNAAYQSAQPLANPVNDAREISQLLTSAGFETISAVNLTHDEMIGAIQQFATRVEAKGPNTVALVYYAGHGVQVAGDNYLVPVDAKIQSADDLQTSGVRLVDLMATLQSIESRMRIVILDACRNNPFPSLDDAGAGLAIVDAPNGSIVGYSTAPGAAAQDGAARHSPYASAFLRLARQPNVPIEQFFKRVRLLVNDTTDGRQTPWESSSLTGDFYFFGETKVAAAKTIQPKEPAYGVSEIRSLAPRAAYDVVIAEDSIEYYEEFVRLYPRDPFAWHIRRLLAGLIQAAAWHQAVLANSPLAYQAFYQQFGSTPYAKTAIKLASQPKTVPLYQPTKLIVPAKLLPKVKQAGGKLSPLPVVPSKKLTIRPDLLKLKAAAQSSADHASNDAAAKPQIRPLPPGVSLLDRSTSAAPLKPGRIRILKGRDGVTVGRVPPRVFVRPGKVIDAPTRVMPRPQIGRIREHIEHPSLQRVRPHIRPSQRLRPDRRLVRPLPKTSDVRASRAQLQEKIEPRRRLQFEGRACQFVSGRRICR